MEYKILRPSSIKKNARNAKMMKDYFKLRKPGVTKEYVYSVLSEKYSIGVPTLRALFGKLKLRGELVQK